MSTTWKLFERWRDKKKFTSNAEAAAALRVPRQSVQNWKNGHNGALHLIERMANDLGEDVATLALAIWQETTKDPADKKVVAKLAHRLGPAALLALVLLGPTTPSAKAATARLSANQQSTETMYYVKSCFLMLLPAW